MSEVLVVGSLAYDSVKTPSGSAEKSLGGSANYFSLAASLLAPVRVVGVVGVIGPTRLNYARVVPMVDFTAQTLTRLLG